LDVLTGKQSRIEYLIGALALVVANIIRIADTVALTAERASVPIPTITVAGSVAEVGIVA
jgi:predicted ATPase